MKQTEQIAVQFTRSELGAIKFALEIAANEVIDGSNTQNELKRLRAVIEHEQKKLLGGAV